MDDLEANEDKSQRDEEIISSRVLLSRTRDPTNQLELQVVRGTPELSQVQERPPSYYRQLSLRFGKDSHLSRAGDLYREMLVDYSNLAMTLDSLFLLGGSYLEGTFTFASDIDVLIELKNFKDIWVVQDVHTPPGYCKLIPYVDDYVECKDFVCIKDKTAEFVYKLSSNNGYLGKSDRLGPAISIPVLESSVKTPSFNKSDIVPYFAFKSNHKYMERWVTRERPFNNPEGSIIEECQQLNTYLVAKGYSKSEEQDVEWRLSMTLQENLLVRHFNPVQKKCHRLLKMFKTDILPHFIEPETLTSYHCKSCMLYMIENTPAKFWRPTNLLTCLQSCLKMLLTWTVTEMCPNYFIPAENMFKGRISNHLLRKLADVLQNMIESNCMWLLQVKSYMFNFSPLMLFIGLPEEYDLPLKGSSDLISKVRIGRRFLENNFSKALVSLSYSKDLEVFLTKLLAVIRRDDPDLWVFLEMPIHSYNAYMEYLLENANTINIKSEIRPNLEVELFSFGIFLLYKRGEDIKPYLYCNVWDKLGSITDIFSVKIKQACLMHLFGYYHDSLEVLHSIATREGHALCLCDILSGKLSMSEYYDLLDNREFIDSVEKATLCITLFLPVDNGMIPAGLQLEMNRRHINALPWVLSNVKTIQSKSATFDSNVLFHYLMYLNLSRLKRDSQAETEIEKLNEIIETSRFLPHRETAYNILGCIYAEQNETEKADECFRKFTEINPEYDTDNLRLEYPDEINDSMTISEQIETVCTVM